jgi:hypothetical protein
MRLANSDILPFDFAANGAALRTFLDELQSANKIDPAELQLASLERRIADFGAAGEQLRDAIFPDLAAGSAAPRQIRRVNAAVGSRIVLFEISCEMLSKNAENG